MLVHINDSALTLEQFQNTVGGFQGSPPVPITATIFQRSRQRMKEETYLPLQNIKILQIRISATGFFLRGVPPMATCTLAKFWLHIASGFWSPAANTMLGGGA